VFAGGWAGSAQCNPAHLFGSRLAGSPCRRTAVKKKPMRLTFGAAVVDVTEG
jgi:hypothetical protein